MTDVQKEALDYFKERAHAEIDELYEFFDEIFDTPKYGPYLSRTFGSVPGTDTDLSIEIKVSYKDGANCQDSCGQQSFPCR